MENGKMFRNQAKTEAPNWDNSIFVPEIHHNSLNFGSELLSDCFFDPNWKNSGDQTDPFESALSSIVSSPATPVAGTSGDDCFVLRELVGKLGSISNSGNDKKSACHSTMVLDHRISGNSPFLPNSTLFSGEPGFSGGNPTCSWLGNGNPGGLKGQTGFNFNGFSHGSTKIPPSDNKITTFSRSENGEFGDSKDESSVSEKNPGAEIEIKAQNHTNPRKRKSNPGGKEKEIPLFFKPQEAETESEAIESEKARSNENEKQSNENQKPPTEPIKDYIHVRARRGQATDSHSLAERVRREKIGERMKFLQDLVPGCNKVTGKAVMLDEIINYVQSLQRQVEFLSMKLANVNPMMDSKDIFQSIYPMGGSTTYGFQSQQGSNQSHNFFSINQLNAAHLLPMTGFGEAAASQDSKLWEDDFQSLIRMGFGQN